MANKRETSKQRRARENRARRAALEARTSGTAPKAPSRVAPVTAEKLAKANQDDRKGGSRAVSKASAVDSEGDETDEVTDAKPRRQRPPRPGDRPVDIDSLEGSWFSKVTQVPGGTQVLMAAGLLIVVTLMMSFMDFYIAPDQVDDPDAKPSMTIFESEGTGRALVLLGIPVVVVGLAVAASLRPNRRRVWLVAAMVIGVLYATSILTYLFVAGFLGYAVMRARKVEGPMEPWLVQLINKRRGGTAADTGTDAED